MLQVFATVRVRKQNKQTNKQNYARIKIRERESQKCVIKII